MNAIYENTTPIIEYHHVPPKIGNFWLYENEIYFVLLYYISLKKTYRTQRTQQNLSFATYRKITVFM